MSLYYDAASVFSASAATGGSFKSRIYSARNLKASPAQVYALITEASKWDVLLKEVIERAELLHQEPKLSPLLALFLVHDFLLSKTGIAAPVNHPLRQAIDRHRTRLKGEFVKARVRRGCTSINDLGAVISCEKKNINSREPASSAPVPTAVYPRWVRINNIRTSLRVQLASTFASYTTVQSLAELGEKGQKKVYIDPNIPDLVAVASGVDFSSTSAYKNGEIILQDKASCFPAYLLLGMREWPGDLIDGCAAPGNKTTHLASLLAKQRQLCNGTKTSALLPRIYSMDASLTRAKTLHRMVVLSGANSFVTVLQGQDFLALDPFDPRFEHVTGLLLDPSCSGSGIVGRDDVPQLALPVIGVAGKPGRGQKGKKRKRKMSDIRNAEEQDNKGQREEGNRSKGRAFHFSASASHGETSAVEEHDDRVSASKADPERLKKLSNLQARIVEHALRFPAATRVTYSTCSVYLIENESVVSRVLASEVARSRGWRVILRDEQPDGLRVWRHRGVRRDDANASPSLDPAVDSSVETCPPVTLSDDELDGCLRCWPGDDEGLGGFFVAGFVRDRTASGSSTTTVVCDFPDHHERRKHDEEEEWTGFSD